jgi:hypothetical protein
VNLNQVHRGAGAEALGTECFLKRAIVTAWGTGLRRLFCEACIVLRCGSLTSEDEKEKRGRRSPCGSVGLSDRKILGLADRAKLWLSYVSELRRVETLFDVNSDQ